MKQFPIQKCELFRKVKEKRGFAEAYFSYAAQKTSQFDAEIAGKGH